MTLPPTLKASHPDLGTCLPPPLPLALRLLTNPQVTEGHGIVLVGHPVASESPRVLREHVPTSGDGVWMAWGCHSVHVAPRPLCYHGGHATFHDETGLRGDKKRARVTQL